MAKIFVYTVIGKGRFPFDMLRYDECWPSIDATALAPIVEPSVPLRSIRMSSYKPPTPQRWASFGWCVDRTPI